MMLSETEIQNIEKQLEHLQRGGSVFNDGINVRNDLIHRFIELLENARKIQCGMHV